MYKITDQNTAEQNSWGTGCSSWELAGTNGLSVKLELMPHGTKEKLHLHNHAQQYFFILKGTATFYLDYKKETITAKQGIWIGAGTPHYIANETGADLEFLVISQPVTSNDRTELE